MFGNGYTPQESAPLLPEGEYKAQIRGAEYGQMTNGQNYVDIYLNIKDENGNCYDGFKPNSKRFFDRPMYPQDVPQEAQAKGRTLSDMQLSWDRQITAFFDAFAIPRGTWTLETWRGKVGFITVKKKLRRRSRLNRRLRRIRRMFMKKLNERLPHGVSSSTSMPRSLRRIWTTFCFSVFCVRKYDEIKTPIFCAFLFFKTYNNLIQCELP